MYSIKDSAWDYLARIFPPWNVKKKTPFFPCSWSSGMTWPSDNDLAMVRIGGRSINDISSQELYTFNSISSNPYETIRAFQRALNSQKNWICILAFTSIFQLNLCVSQLKKIMLKKLIQLLNIDKKKNYRFFTVKYSVCSFIQISEPSTDLPTLLYLGISFSVQELTLSRENACY